MKKILKVSGIFFLGLITVCAISYFTDNATFTNWKITNKAFDKSQISWTKFRWGGDTLGGKYYERVAMLIPCKIEGLPNTFIFQFDLGADQTGVYENTFRSFCSITKELEKKIQKLKSPLQFWDKKKFYKDLKLSFENYEVTNKIGFVYKNYGEPIVNPNFTDTFHLGTIGVDLFRDKILVIDYPLQRFAICDVLPEEFNKDLIDIEIDEFGKVVLPMKIHGHNYRITFDNGSSLFPLITATKNINNFSTLPETDSIKISSWGTLHTVTGRLITDSFELAGKKFCNVKIYSNHSGLGLASNTDGVAGNALFWDRTLIIDFKNKKFGLK